MATGAELTLVVLREGLDAAHRDDVLRRLAGVGIVQLVFARGALAVVDHERHELIRSWREVQVVGAVSVDPRRLGVPTGRADTPVSSARAQR